MEKNYLPKVGEKFYYKNHYGDIIERTCVYIRSNEDTHIEAQYFTEMDEHGGLFVNESCIIDPNGEEVQAYIKEKEKQDWINFWTQKRIDEISQNFPEIFTDQFMNFIKSKTE